LTLSRPEQTLLVKAWLFLPLIAAGLRLFGFRRCLRVMARLENGVAAHDAEEVPPNGPALRTARMVQLAARHGIVRPSCLERSLVLWWLLLQQKMAASLRIGTRRQKDRIEAHAWVEMAGCVLNDSQDVGRRFRAFSGLAEAMRRQRAGRKPA